MALRITTTRARIAPIVFLRCLDPLSDNNKKDGMAKKNPRKVSGDMRADKTCPNFEGLGAIEFSRSGPKPVKYLIVRVSMKISSSSKPARTITLVFFRAAKILLHSQRLKNNKNDKAVAGAIGK